MTYELTPQDINEFNSQQTQQQQPAQPQGYTGVLGNDLNSPGANFLRGAGAGFGNTYINAANMLPGVNIPNIPRPQGAASSLGNFAGNVGSFLAGGEALDVARAGAEALPVIGGTAKALGGAAMVPTAIRQGLGWGAYGAANDPNNRGLGALTGVVSGVAGAVTPFGTQALSKYIESGSPEVKMQNVIQRLGNGAQGIEDNGKTLANYINNAYGAAQKNNGALYNNVLQQVGDKSIYKLGQAPDYANLPPKVTDSYNSDIDDLHNAFLKNPTFSNAKELSSQLYGEKAYFDRQESLGTLDTAGRNQRASIMKARSALDNDMNSFLSGYSPQVKSEYLGAKNDFIQNVLPFRADSNIRDMATGEETNPINVSNAFRNPSLAPVAV